MNIILGISDICAGVLILIVCIPLIKGSVKMNTYYGIRFKQSYASEKAWYAINRYGGIQFAIWSIVLMLIGTVIMVIPIQPPSIAYWLALFVPLIMLVPAITSYLFAKKYRDDD